MKNHFMSTSKLKKPHIKFLPTANTTCELFKIRYKQLSVQLHFVTSVLQKIHPKRGLKHASRRPSFLMKSKWSIFDCILRNKSFAKIFNMTKTVKKITQLSIEYKISISTDGVFCEKSLVMVFHMSPPPRNTANCPIPIWGRVDTFQTSFSTAQFLNTVDVRNISPNGCTYWF